jgi:hypothetical protein
LSPAGELRVLEIGVPRKIFRPKKDEMTGGWRKLHDEEPHNMYFLSSIIRMISQGD